MEIIAQTTNFTIAVPTAVAIGKFDGVHIGHRKLLQEILSCKKQGLAACVFTFDPSPAKLFGSGEWQELSTRDEKRRLFEAMGVDYLVEYPMTFETAAISPEDFVQKLLLDQMRMQVLAAGTDVSFGAKGAGNAELLREYEKQGLFKLRLIEKVKVCPSKESAAITVSSSAVRELIKAGNMQSAAILLGRAYDLSGTVIHGRAMGHSLGFPTINIRPESDKLMPPFGVYRSLVRVGDVCYHGVTNIGRKPTVQDGLEVGAETYLYDFDGDLYEAFVQIELLEFKRPERKFAGLEELKAQLREDIQASRP